MGRLSAPFVHQQDPCGLLCGSGTLEQQLPQKRLWQNGVLTDCDRRPDD